MPLSWDCHAQRLMWLSFLSFNRHKMCCVPKEATIVFLEDTVDPGRADQHLTGNSAVPVAFVSQGYTCLLVASLERSATPMASSWKHQNPVPEKAGVWFLTLQLKPRPIYTGRWCREGKDYRRAILWLLGMLTILVSF